MSCAHPGFDRAERMLGRVPSHLHRIWVCVEPPLHVIKHVLVLPSADAPVVCRGALRAQCAPRAGRRPVLVDGHTPLDASEAANGILASWTEERVPLTVVHEVTFVIPTLGPTVRCEH